MIIVIYFLNYKIIMEIYQIGFIIVLLQFILTFLSTTWMKSRIEESIKHEYAKELEEYRNEIEKRNKAEKISELLSEWLNHPESQKELNKLSINLFLWLPDNLAIDLSNLLSHSKTSPVDIRDFIFNIRKYLIYNTNLNKNNIILFTKETFRRKLQIELKNSNKSMSNKDIDNLTQMWLSIQDFDKILETIK